MPRVTVGVPVYNGADLIEECIECLLAQDYDDFEIVISDNGSTDGTSEICARLAQSHPRVTHLRREETIPFLQNFYSLSDRCTSPYFMWRAHDDLSSENFVRLLAEQLDANPHAAIATGVVNREYGGVRPDRFLDFDFDRSSGRLIRILRFLFYGHASWYYALWRTEECQRISRLVDSRYQEPWAGDHLNLAYCALEDAICGDRRAVFRQRITRTVGSYMQKHNPSAEQMIARNELFRAAYLVRLEEVDLTRREKMVLRALAVPYTWQKCYPIEKIIKTRWKQRRAGGADGQ